MPTLQVIYDVLVSWDAEKGQKGDLEITEKENWEGFVGQAFPLGAETVTETSPKILVPVCHAQIKPNLKHRYLEIEKVLFNMVKARGQDSKISQIRLPHKATVGRFYTARE